MSAVARLAAFAAVLLLVSGAAALAGGAIDPKGAGKSDAAHAKDQGGGHVSAPHEQKQQHPVRGLGVAESGLRIEVTTPELRRGARERLTYRVVDADGQPVRDFDVEHERRMHLIVVRRDLTGFQHLHPEIDGEGNWSAPVKLDDAGSYRMFADFARGGESHTLAADLRVDGAADLRDLPPAASVATTDDGYQVRRQGSELHFEVTRGGKPVDVEPYLGAGGHLVALREGDLAFLHVHPTDDHDLAFEATFPTPGRYRLFLQFKHGGRVHTAAFTQEVR